MTDTPKDNPQTQPIGPQPSKPASARKLPEQQVDQAEDLEQRMSAFERSTLRLTRVGLLVAGLTGAVIALQWYEMRKGGVDTHDLAEAAKAQSEAAKAIAESAKAQSENTAKLAEFTSEEVTQLAANVKESHAATDRADLAMKRSERPWVNAESLDVSIKVPEQLNHPLVSIKATIHLRNSGKSVALNGWTWMDIVSGSSVQTLNKDWHKACDTISTLKDANAKNVSMPWGAHWPIGFVLVPGQEYPFDITFGNPTLNGADFRFIGCTIYDDQYGGPSHHTTFCFQPTNTGTAINFVPCNGFAEAN